ncbi:MAG: proline racemase family protein [Proteobacteria bacterium]|nr:proline racemase family protein [Pseudomonadota bacterium]
MQSARTITVIGCHAEGEVGRVITGGVLPPPGDSLFAQREYLRTQADGLRKFLLYEPRGGAFVHTNLVVPPKTPGADAGFIIMEPTDYPAMSGSNAICVATVLLETGMVAMRGPETVLALDTPGGLIQVVADCRDGRCRNVRIRNVPCFVAKLEAIVEVAGLGSLTCDIAYGGAFFAIFDAPGLGFALVPDEARDLVEMGERIKSAVVAQHPVSHPENPGIHTVTFTQFAAPLTRDAAGRTIGRNTVVISPGKLDRSPCGTGSSARLAVLHRRGQIGLDDILVSQSVLSTEFQCRIDSVCEVGGLPAISPSVQGRAWITGSHQYTLDPDDPFPQGYTLSDTWYRTLA